MLIIVNPLDIITKKILFLLRFFLLFQSKRSSIIIFVQITFLIVSIFLFHFKSMQLENSRNSYFRGNLFDREMIQTNSKMRNELYPLMARRHTLIITVFRNPKMAADQTKLNLIMSYIAVFMDVLGYALITPILPFLCSQMNASDIEEGLIFTGYSVTQAMSSFGGFVVS